MLQTAVRLSFCRFRSVNCSGESIWNWENTRVLQPGGTMATQRIPCEPKDGRWYRTTENHSYSNHITGTETPFYSGIWWNSVCDVKITDTLHGDWNHIQHNCTRTTSIGSCRYGRMVHPSDGEKETAGGGGVRDAISHAAARHRLYESGYHR